MTHPFDTIEIKVPTQSMAAAMAFDLVMADQWFAVTPMGGDRFIFTGKDEANALSQMPFVISHIKATP